MTAISVLAFPSIGSCLKGWRDAGRGMEESRVDLAADEHESRPQM